VKVEELQKFVYGIVRAKGDNCHHHHHHHRQSLSLKSGSTMGTNHGEKLTNNNKRKKDTTKPLQSDVKLTLTLPKYIKLLS